MKICVYAIAKNEEQFVDRWAASMSEADDICVLDTGSTDRTVEQLADLGVRVRQEEIRPWRFGRCPQPLDGADPGGHGRVRMHRPGRDPAAGLAGEA